MYKEIKERKPILFVRRDEIKCTPMTLGEFIDIRGGEPYTYSLEAYNKNDDGYLLEFDDGLSTWGPKEYVETKFKKADTFVDRLKIEFDELSDKKDKLNKFFDTDTYKNLSGTERTLLQAQFGAMLAYSQILIARIAYYNGPKSSCNVMPEEAGTCSDTCCGCESISNNEDDGNDCDGMCYCGESPK